MCNLKKNNIMNTMFKKKIFIIFSITFFCFQAFADNQIYHSGPLTKDSTNGSWFDRSLYVYGIKIVVAGEAGGSKAVPDEWPKKLAQVIKMMLNPNDPLINSTAQKNVIKTLRGDSGTFHENFPAGQRVAYGGCSYYKPCPLRDDGIKKWPGYEEWLDSHSVNDMVWYKNQDSRFTGDDDINEVLEHLMHTLHLFGVRGGVEGSEEALKWASDWFDEDFQKAELWLAMKEAIDNNVYDVRDYANGNPKNPDIAHVMMKEYMYLLNYNMWEFGKEFWEGGSLAPEWNNNSRDPQGIKMNNPLGFKLFQKYFVPVLSKPDKNILRDIFKNGDKGDALAGLSGYISD